LLAEVLIVFGVALALVLGVTKIRSRRRTGRPEPARKAPATAEPAPKLVPVAHREAAEPVTEVLAKPGPPSTPGEFLG
jgi:hypothetical protein